MVKKYLYFFIFSVFSTYGADIKTLYQLYNQSNYLNQAQLYSLEIQLANQLLQKARELNLKKLTSSQKEEKKKNIDQALFFYSQSLEKVESAEEKAKILFRIGYLYEMQNFPSQAVKVYQRILSISKDQNRRKRAENLIKEMKTDSLDLEELLKLAQQAFGKGQYEHSLQLYRKYIIIEKNRIQSNMKLKKDHSQSFSQIENVFRLYHEVVQKIKDPYLQITACDFYLEQSILRTFAFEAGFLKNKALFDLEKFEEVAPVFRQMALSKDEKFSEQAAFLSLRALMKINQGLTAQKWAVEFSSIFPEQKEAFENTIQSNLLDEII